MLLVKPNWIVHPDENRPTKPNLTLYSLSVHPDGSRLATGGLDSIIRVWSTVPVLHEQAERDDKCPRLLSTLTAHTGPVMAVRWSNSGAYLASGSDDGAVLIWAHAGSAGGKVWGSDTTNVENWKAVRRLVGHQSDVADVAWSSDDAYLASVGLDNQVLIWSGQNFELVRKLEGHLGFVKGLCFDPVGQYLATQSDDNSVKVWRTDDWRLHADIKEPFTDAPKSNISRPTWSPDGAHIVTPNAMNGPIFVAAVISRQDWKSPSSLIGHPDIVQVAAYNPLLFLRDASQPATLPNLASLVAICARSSISLWFSDMAQPFVVLDDVFDRDVLDLSWSKDGMQLWASSSEGHVAVLTFDLSEYAPVAPAGTAASLHSVYGYTPRRIAAPSRPLTPQSSMTGAGGTVGQPNKLVARKGPNAKRPKLLNNGQPLQPSPLQNTTNFAPAQSQAAPQTAAAAAFANAPTYASPALVGNAFASSSTAQLPPQYAPPLQPQQHPHPPFASFGPVATPVQAQVDPSSSRKRKASMPATAQGANEPSGAYGFYSYPSDPPPQVPGYGSAPRLSAADYRLKGHTLGQGDFVRDAPAELRELVPAYCLRDREVTFKVTNRVLGEAGKPGKGKERVLAVPAVMSHGKLGVEDSEAKDTFEWRNLVEGERNGQAECRVVTAKKALWVDYLPGYVVSVAGSPAFTAVSLEDGSLVTWSPTGRRLTPTLVLDSPCSFLTAEASFLLAITALGTLTVWDLSPSIPKPRSIYPPLNISSLLASSASRSHPSPTITTSSVLPNGTPLLALDSGATFSYDADLASWTRVSEPWWAKSDLWEGRRGRPGHGVAQNRGIIRTIEGAVNEIVVDEQLNGTGEPESDSDQDDEKANGNADGDVEMNGSGADKGLGKAHENENGNGAERAKKPSKRAVPEGAPASPQGSTSDFRMALSLAHLETRMKAAVALDSPSEYRAFLIAYAKKLADEGLRSKAEELIKELLGPVYNKPGKKVEDEWSATVLGLNKRELLRDVVLRELAKERVTKPLAEEYQKLLREISAA
ncbi:hypothetical protein JCM21900_003136 [Sporobolomyces salmonicolor]